MQRRGAGRVTTEAKIGVMLLQIKKSLMPRGPGRGKKVSPRPLRLNTAHGHLDFGLLAFKTLREYICAVSSHHGCCNLFCQP